MARKTTYRDPRGHSIRVYSDLFDSPAWSALSPHDVMTYLALLRELRAYNNGDLSLPLSRAKSCGIGHHVTLARSLRALTAVGLIAITRKGGSAKGGQRLATLYRVTDRECFDIPAKHLEARPATNEWKRVTSRDHGLSLIAEAEAAAKTKSQGHRVTPTTSSGDVVEPKTMSPGDVWTAGPRHRVTMAENGANPMSARPAGRFVGEPENPSHRTPRVPPLYIASPSAVNADDGDQKEAAPWATLTT